MTFDHAVEMLIDGEWVDITSYVDGMDGRDAVSITRGSNSEQNRPPPTSVTFTLNDNDALFNNNNPLSPYAGKIGRNTPIRVRTTPTVVTDTFTRTVSSGWGSSPDGGEWRMAIAQGTPFAYTQLNVTGSAATCVVPVANAYRTMDMPTIKAADCTVYVECAVPQATGGALEPSVFLRFQRHTTTVTGLLARVLVNTDNSVQIRLIQFVDSTETTLTTVSTGLTHAGTGTPLKIRVQAEGEYFRCRVWQTTEPGTWTAEVTQDDVLATGAVALRSGVASGNTNVPVTFTWDNYDFEDDGIRAIVELASIKPKWVRNADGVDVARVAIEGAGVLRRLDQGSPKLKSVAYRAFMNPAHTATTLAYFPMEEESDFSDPFLTNPLNLASRGRPYEYGPDPFLLDYGAYTGHPAASRMITFGEDTRIYIEDIPEYTSDETKIMSLWHLPSTVASASERQLYRIHTTNGSSYDYVDFVWNSSAGQMGLNAWKNGSILNSSLFATDAELILDQPICLALEFTKTGSDVLARIVFYTGDSINLGDATWTSKTFGSVRSITIGDRRIFDVHDLEGVSIGHTVVTSDVDAYRNFVSTGAPFGFRAFAGETAGARFKRLCEEEGQAVVVAGELDTSEAMGPQRDGTLLDLLVECQQVDMGIIYEPRSSLAIGYRCRGDLYNQMRIPVAYSDLYGLTPVDDDRYVRNDVSASRVDGGEFRFVIEDDDPEHLTTQPPPAGVGTYEDSPSFNCETDSQLEGLAGWLAHITSWADTRYSAAIFELARSAMSDRAVAGIQLAGVGDAVELDTTGSGPWVQPGEIRWLNIGFQEQLGRMQHEITAITVPADPYEVAIIGDTDEVTNLRGARIDSDESSLTIGIDSTDTSFDVTSTGSTRWTTSADEFDVTKNGGGLYIKVGGERMRVTNISGTGATQTFTVVRSDNSVVKSHDAGTMVRVAYPARIGL